MISFFKKQDAKLLAGDYDYEECKRKLGRLLPIRKIMAISTYAMAAVLTISPFVGEPNDALSMLPFLTIVFCCYLNMEFQVHTLSLAIAITKPKQVATD